MGSQQSELVACCNCQYANVLLIYSVVKAKPAMRIIILMTEKQT